MGINISSIAKYVENYGVKSILHTKPQEFSKINFGELKVLKTDVFTPNIGKHKIPRFLYHFTNKEAYESMLKDGKIKQTLNDPLSGVYLVDLSNFFKRWNKIGGCGDDVREGILQLATNGYRFGGNVVLLKIPTEKLQKANLRIRMERTFHDIKDPQDLWEWVNKFKQGIPPPTKYEHAFLGDKASNSKLYKQKKEALAFVCPEEIKITNTEKIGEIETNFIKKNSLKNIYLKLLEGTPEQKAADKILK